MVNIPRLKCDLNFGLPVLIVFGIIYSLWASSFLFVSLDIIIYIYRYRRDDFLLVPVIDTYYILCLYTSVMLYYGFKNSDKKCIQYWYLLKLVECSLIIFGALVNIRDSTIWPLLLAVMLLGAGMYLITSIQLGYRELGIELDSVSSHVFKIFQCSNQNQGSPPLSEADQQPQENINPLAVNILRSLGFLKIFEFVIISPALLIIIMNSCILKIGSYEYNYWNIFWLLAGAGLCFTLCIRFVWKMIPQKSSSENLKHETEELVKNAK